MPTALPRPAAPVVPTSGRARLRPLGIDCVAVGDGEWRDWQEQTARVSLAHAMDWLERHGAFEQYRRLDPENPTTDEKAGRGLSWAGDSDLYKTLEAAAWSLSAWDAPELRQFLATSAALLARVQEPDGYLHTQIQNGDGVAGFNGASTTERFQATASEELYCLGHLIQAGIAHRRVTGETELFDIARRAADCIVVSFQDRPDYADGHPEVEMALVEMFRETGDRAYLTMADQFLSARGYGHVIAAWGTGGTPSADYTQDGVPVREQTRVVGHAVCSLYLLCGMADVAVETQDDGLFDAVLAQWNSMSRSQVYLTGAVGSRHDGEAFGDSYELPQDLMYGESCAAVAHLMLAWRLLLATGESRFADAMERISFNVIRGSIALDGRGFFYANPMHLRRVREAADPDTPGHHGDTPGTRPPWFDCACCPPNILRTIASFSAYAATTDADGVQLQQYLPATIDAGEITLRVETDYPTNGTVRIVVDRTSAVPWTLGLRRPGWAPRLGLSLAGADLDAEVDDLGYVRIRRTWAVGDEVVLTIPLEPRLTVAHPSAEAIRGTAAVERGPHVYAVESNDQAEDLDLERVALFPGTSFEEVSTTIAGRPAIALRARAFHRDDVGWEDALYRPLAEVTPSTGREVPLVFIPYGLWANRGPSTLRVFLPLVG